MAFKQEFKKKFLQLVDESKKISITSHISTDYDAVCSMLILYKFLIEEYPDKEVQMILEDHLPPNSEKLLNADKIEIYDDIRGDLENYDLNVFLDGAEFARYTHHDAVSIEESKSKKVIIDHHLELDQKGLAAKLTDTDYLSATQILFSLFFEEKPDTYFERDFVDVIILGLLFDPKGIRYAKSTDDKFFPSIDRLLKLFDIRVETYFNDYFLELSKEGFEVAKELMQNTQFLKIGDWPGVLVSHIDKSFVEKIGSEDNFIKVGKDAFLDGFGKTVRDYKWSLVFKEDSDGVSISGRSNPGNVNIGALFGDLKLGGGHARAGGAFNPTKDKPPTFEETLEIFRNYMENNDPILD